MNNSAASFSYFAVIKSQILANVALTVTMLLVILVLYYRNGFQEFENYFRSNEK